MLDSFNMTQRIEIEEYVRGRLQIHTNELHLSTYPQWGTFGGDSQDVKPEESTTTRTPAMGTTDTSSLLSELGDLLAELDTHINTLMKLKNTTLLFYKRNLAGDNGLSVAEYSDFDRYYEEHKKSAREFLEERF